MNGFCREITAIHAVGARFIAPLQDKPRKPRNQSFTHGELHLTLGGNFRVGTELFSRGPLSIRADVFGRVTIAPRPLSKPLSVSDEPTPFAGGVAVMGLWSFE